MNMLSAILRRFNRRKFCLLLFAFTLVYIIITTQLDGHVPSLDNSILRYILPWRLDLGLDPNRTRLIIYWTPFFAQEDWFRGYGSEPFQNCPYKCATTSDKSLYSRADAILAHIREEGLSVSDLPAYKRPHQNWIMGVSESPVHVYKDLSQFNGLFNISWTYNLKSEVQNWYVAYEKANVAGVDNDRATTTNHASGKDKQVAWFASNCHPQSQREKYVEQLQTFLPVDIYGACGPLVCPKNEEAKCLDLLQTYKFYLSFENSLCTDYVTEKVLLALDNNIVPIVLGGADYTKFLPPKSFINVRDFSSPSKLADFIKTVDKNDTLYNSYFEWKSNYRKKQTSSICELCRFLHQHEGEKHVIERMDEFWSKEKDCVSPSQFYNDITENGL